MRTTIVAALAAVLLGTAVPPAGAHQDSRYYGQCYFDSVSQDAVTGPNRWTGEVHAYVAVWSRDHGNPVTATVTCDVRVDGVSQDTVSGSGAGVVAVAGRVDYVATDVQVVDLCAVVDFTSDDTPTADFCNEPTADTMPPGWVIDALNYVFDFAVTPVMTGVVDPLACAAIAALAPGVGPVTVVDGDLYLGQDAVYDCPPYAWTPNPPPPPPPLPDTTPPNGAGWNDGTTGSLLLATSSEVAACAFRLDPATGEVTVTGAALTAPGPGAIRCVLRDADTGAVVYDESAAAVLSDRRTVSATALVVCTEGAGTGLHCR